MDLRIKKERQIWFEKLYEHSFPEVARLIKSMGGNYEDAKDTFHDALILLYEKQRDTGMPDHPKAYLKTIARNLYLRNKQIDNSQTPFPEDIIAGKEKPIEEINQRLLQYLRRAGKKCLQILQAFYYHKWSMDEIATQFDFKTRRSATVQKYKCLEKVRKDVKEKSLNQIMESYA